MKKLLLLFSLIATTTYAQHSFVTKNKDTLYLVNDDLAKQIIKVWEEYYVPARDGKKPAIILVDVVYVKNRMKKNQTKTTTTKISK